MSKLVAMRTLRRVVELGSFTAAAKDLRLSKSAVSKHIARLEHDLQSPLLIRSTRRLSPTDTGLRYLAVCIRVLDAISEAEAELGAMGPKAA